MLSTRATPKWSIDSHGAIPIATVSVDGASRTIWIPPADSFSRIPTNSFHTVCSSSLDASGWAGSTSPVLTWTSPVMLARFLRLDVRGIHFGYSQLGHNKITVYLIARIIKTHCTIREDFRDAQSKFAKIVLAKAIAIPAYCFDEFGVGTSRDCNIKDGIPDRIQGFMSRLSGESLVMISEHKKLGMLVSPPKQTFHIVIPDRWFRIYLFHRDSAPKRGMRLTTRAHFHVDESFCTCNIATCSTRGMG